MILSPKKSDSQTYLTRYFFWDLKYPYSRQYAERKCWRKSICIKGSSYETSLSINVMTSTCYKCPPCKKYHFITGYLTTLASFRWRKIAKASPQEAVYKYQREGHISLPTKIKYHIYLGCILRHVLKNCVSISLILWSNDISKRVNYVDLVFKKCCCRSFKIV